MMQSIKSYILSAIFMLCVVTGALADSTTAILASAIGDAMGAPIEQLNIAKKDFKKVYPDGIAQVADLKPTDWMQTTAGKVIPYTDDTAMALDTLGALLMAQDRYESLPATMAYITNKYIESMHKEDGWAASFRLPGVSTLKNIRKAEENRANNKSSERVWYNPLTWGKASTEWWQAGGSDDGGCGSVMRAYPFGIIFADDPQKAALWAVEHSKITHGAPIALAACSAMATGVAYALQGKDPLFIANAMEKAARVYDGKTANMIAQARAYAQMESVTSEQVFKQWPGWAAHDAIASTVYVFLKHSDDVQKSLILGANMHGDSDSIASMAGALVGARSNQSTLPAEWLKHLENKDYITTLANKVIGLQQIKKWYPKKIDATLIPFGLCKESVRSLYKARESDNRKTMPGVNPDVVIGMLAKEEHDGFISVNRCAHILQAQFLEEPNKALLCMSFIYARSPFNTRDSMRNFFAYIERVAGSGLPIDFLEILENNTHLMGQLQAADDRVLMQRLERVMHKVAAAYKDLGAYDYDKRRATFQMLEKSSLLD